MVAPGSGGGNGFDADLRAESRRLRGCGGSAGLLWLWPSRAEGSREKGSPQLLGKLFPGCGFSPRQKAGSWDGFPAAILVSEVAARL